MGACDDLGQSASSVVVTVGDTSAGEVAFRWAGPGEAAMVVPVRINGSDTVDMILDTGATMTCIDTALATTLALPERRAVIGAAVGIGGAGRVRLHRTDSLRIGGTTVHRVDVCAMDLQALRTLGPRVRGLLGLNVLRSFHLAIDFERGVLRLTPAGG